MTFKQKNYHKSNRIGFLKVILNYKENPKKHFNVCVFNFSWIGFGKAKKLQKSRYSKKTPHQLSLYLRTVENSEQLNYSVTILLYLHTDINSRMRTQNPVTIQRKFSQKENKWHQILWRNLICFRNSITTLKQFKKYSVSKIFDNAKRIFKNNLILWKLL